MDLPWAIELALCLAMVFLSSSLSFDRLGYVLGEFLDKFFGQHRLEFFLLLLRGNALPFLGRASLLASGEVKDRPLPLSRFRRGGFNRNGP